MKKLLLVGALVLLILTAGGSYYYVTHMRAGNVPAVTWNITNAKTKPVTEPVTEPVTAPHETIVHTINGFSFAWPYAVAYATSTQGDMSGQDIQLLDASGGRAADVHCPTYGNYEGPFDMNQVKNVTRDFSKSGVTFHIYYRTYIPVPYPGQPLLSGPNLALMGVSSDTYKNAETLVWQDDACSLETYKSSSQEPITNDLLQAFQGVYDSWK